MDLPGKHHWLPWHMTSKQAPHDSPWLKSAVLSAAVLVPYPELYRFPYPHAPPVAHTHDLHIKMPWAPIFKLSSRSVQLCIPLQVIWFALSTTALHSREHHWWSLELLILRYSTSLAENVGEGGEGESCLTLSACGVAASVERRMCRAPAMHLLHNGYQSHGQNARCVSTGRHRLLQQKKGKESTEQNHQHLSSDSKWKTWNHIAPAISYASHLKTKFFDSMYEDLSNVFLNPNSCNYLSLDSRSPAIPYHFTWSLKHRQ